MHVNGKIWPCQKFGNNIQYEKSKKKDEKKIVKLSYFISLPQRYITFDAVK